jgi:tRNA uridine 5-carboxymethylaminomethyl modification enzyme
MDLLEDKISKRDSLIYFLTNFSIKPDQINNFLESKESSPLRQGVKLIDLVSRPQISIIDLVPEIEELKSIADNLGERGEEIIDSAEILIKYSGYIEREKLIADKFKRLDEIIIEKKFDYPAILSLSTEARQKLQKINPKTIGQASRIPGVSPSDISILLVMLGR